MRKRILLSILLIALATWSLTSTETVQNRAVSELSRIKNLATSREIQALSDSSLPIVEYFPTLQTVESPTSYAQYDGISGLIERGGPTGKFVEQYARIDENREQPTQDNNISTFSVDVDTASYSNVRRFLNNGSFPPEDSVRVEEMVNYFSYDYPQPAVSRPFSISSEMAACPWDENKKLLSIGLQAQKHPQSSHSSSNVVLLVDVSGSMDSDDKLPLLKTALKAYANTLKDSDIISLVTYAGGSQIVLEPTSGKDHDSIHQAIDRLQAGGGTNGARGIFTAYDLARQNFLKNGVNRVLLATDGDFNVGLNNHNDLMSLIQAQRESGVYLTVLGLGTGNLNDHLMEQLADQGNGSYAYLDSDKEAERVLIDQAASRFVPVADDVKLQVEFNPKVVKSFRQVGYENRQLEKHEFEDDRKDAGDIGLGHQVTALYELEFSAETQRFQCFGEVRARYKKPGEKESLLLKAPLYSAGEEPSEDFRFQSAVAEFGLYLRGQSEARLERVTESLIEVSFQTDTESKLEFRAMANSLKGTSYWSNQGLSVCER